MKTKILYFVVSGKITKVPSRNGKLVVNKAKQIRGDNATREKICNKSS